MKGADGIRVCPIVIGNGKECKDDECNAECVRCYGGDFHDCFHDCETKNECNP